MFLNYVIPAGNCDLQFSLDLFDVIRQLGRRPKDVTLKKRGTY